MEDPGRHSAEARARTRLGRVLKSKWRLDRLIGVGGMGAVYAATHRNGREVAVKMLHASLSQDDEVRGRFLREGYVANKIKHPGAVIVLDDDIDDQDGSVFLVMELLEGQTVESLWRHRGQRLAPSDVLRIADSVLDVLAVAHAQGIVHRDIKPDNIYLSNEGVVKILDFGISRLREVSAVSELATRSGFFMGTPAFMAPEQARARWSEMDARSDLWALGATMFTLLSGRLVHEADTVNEVLLAAMTKRAPSLRDVAPDCPPEVVRIVDRALAFDKTERWLDAASMQVAVREALAPPTDPETAETVAARPPQVPSEESEAEARTDTRSQSAGQQSAEPDSPAMDSAPSADSIGPEKLTTSRGITCQSDIGGMHAARDSRRRRVVSVTGVVAAALVLLIVGLVLRAPSRVRPGGGTVANGVESTPSPPSAAVQPSTQSAIPTTTTMSPDASTAGLAVTALPLVKPQQTSEARTASTAGGRSSPAKGASTGPTAQPTSVSAAPPTQTAVRPPEPIDYDRQR